MWTVVIVIKIYDNKLVVVSRTNKPYFYFDIIHLWKQLQLYQIILILQGDAGKVGGNGEVGTKGGPVRLLALFAVQESKLVNVFYCMF